ncbi:hypothetical protein ACQP2P_15740 [Dactylosporangium sp. CA-139114]|uniref:hypothetical protein n=1 Tax=Dactylosporangium sp. CA-139114 TaxID=3239931 RepID=UPI003D95492E
MVGLLVVGGVVLGPVLGPPVVGLTVGDVVGDVVGLLLGGDELGLPVVADGVGLPPGAAQVATARLMVAASVPAPALMVTCIAMMVTDPSPLRILTPCATVPFLPSGPAAVPLTLDVVWPLVQDADAEDAETRPSKAEKPVTVALALPPPACTVAALRVMVPSEERAPPLALCVVPSVEDTDGLAPIGAAPLAEMP